jgi:hypothetical protein
MRAIRIIILLLALQPQPVLASDTCSGRAIITAADVSVSDGSGFRTASFYRSKDSAAIRHIDDRDRTVAVEGPLGWARDGERAELGSGFYKLFALGHQYHALLLEFGASMTTRPCRITSVLTTVSARSTTTIRASTSRPSHRCGFSIPYPPHRWTRSKSTGCTGNCSLRTALAMPA